MASASRVSQEMVAHGFGFGLLVINPFNAFLVSFST
jgi:hypothetical protein